MDGPWHVSLLDDKKLGDDPAISSGATALFLCFRFWPSQESDWAYVQSRSIAPSGYKTCPANGQRQMPHSHQMSQKLT
jgi:hypothetical protein